MSKPSDNPCYHCPHRHTRCHAECGEYAEFRQRREDHLNRAARAQDSLHDLFVVTGKKYRRWPKKRRPNT